MEEALKRIAAWVDAGEPMLLIAAGAVVALCFVVFNAVRIALYVPQLRTCLRDVHGCPTINLLTWCSWIVANASTGLYMWMFQGDAWGLVLNLGNAAMCTTTVAVTLIKRRRFAAARKRENAQVITTATTPRSHTRTGSATDPVSITVTQPRYFARRVAIGPLRTDAAR